MPHSCTADPEEAAIRIAAALTRRATLVDLRLLTADIRLLAKAPAGLHHLEQALTSYGDEEVTMMVRALIHQTAAELKYETDRLLFGVRAWSICCVAVGCAVAAVLLAAIGLDPFWRLAGLAGTAAVLSAIGLATIGLAARRRGQLLTAVQALTAAYQHSGRPFEP